MHRDARLVREPRHEPAESLLLLKGVEPAFDGAQVQVAPNLSIQRITPVFVERLEQQGLANARELVGNLAVLVESRGTASTYDLMRPHALVTGLVLGSDLRVVPAVHVIISHPPGRAEALLIGSPIPGRGEILWGHSEIALTEEHVQDAAGLWTGISKVRDTDEFHRIGNALLFYENGYNSDNPDLALVAFTTCLESLFSTATEEIAFRLSMRVAGFLADANHERRDIFADCREVYKVRSKIVHGAPIVRRSPEQSAIYLVEHVVPQAENLARRSLRKVFELQLESVFENAERVNALFDALLFKDSLDKALAEIGQRRRPPAN